VTNNTPEQRLIDAIVQLKVEQRDREWEDVLAKASGDQRPPLTPALVEEWWGRVVSNTFMDDKDDIEDLQRQVFDLEMANTSLEAGVADLRAALDAQGQAPK
jgi:hypothetical protein